MKRAACVVLPLLLWACEPAVLPPPSIVSVTPERVGVGMEATLSVRVSAELPLVVDYADQSVDPERLGMEVHVGGLPVPIPFAEPDGTLIIPVPEGLSLGSYDVQVTLADGREAVRERAFSVVPAPTLNGGSARDGGTPEDGGTGGSFPEVGGGIFGFHIDHVEDQVRDRPFQLTIRAVGPDASLFTDAVSVRASKGQVQSLTRGAFAKGVRVEQVSLSQPGPLVFLLVKDNQGHLGLSNPFRVHPH